MKTYYHNDADSSYLDNKIIAVIGYGSQGHAHAQNLKESGHRVIVGLHESSKTRERAQADGFTVLPVCKAAEQADIIMFLSPDTVQPHIFTTDVLPHLTSGKACAFAHGFNVHYGQIVPPVSVDVWMVAPKSPGHLLRRMYQQGAGVPCLVAVYHDASGHAFQTALAYADALGGTRAGVIETTFAEETETDLFGEQAVLCGGVAELIKAGFDTLVHEGYQPQIAYFECLNELKLIVDLIYEHGISGMYDRVSKTAQYGGLSKGTCIVDERTREKMKKVLDDVRQGEFAREWVLENHAGCPVLKAKKHHLANHQIEVVGEKLRQMMHWVKQ